MKRRNVLKASASLWLIAWQNALFGSQSSNHLRYFGEPCLFDFAWLKGRAQYLAGLHYEDSKFVLPRQIKALDWDQYQAIKYRDEATLWRNDASRFQVKFFHLGMYVDQPVDIFEIRDGMAHQLAYDRKMFDYGKSGLKEEGLASNIGFAGFRIFFHTDWTRDITAFLGASYFRAVGGDWQYGLSARGLAIDYGLSSAEEFPRFTSFWLERPAPEADYLVVYALLDSPSVVGAYRFEIRPGTTLTMDVDVALYPRKKLTHVGIAPLTSMFRCGTNDCPARDDWRPEIHDSDGLSMWRGNGEIIWRPLTDPAQVRLNSYQDENPRGFGLLQRDRKFDHYQDDGVFYDRRPSVWVEPKTNWGSGEVQLLELPTEDEISDNILSVWHSNSPALPGQESLYAYRLYWGETRPLNSSLAYVVATRTGLGGVVGRKRGYFSWRFVVDFAGGDLAMLGATAQPTPRIAASSGEIELVSARPLVEIHGYRAMFDLKPGPASEPINLRLNLEIEGQILTETWMYQWTPPNRRRP
jgi:glucans biosynthesis protein